MVWPGCSLVPNPIRCTTRSCGANDSAIASLLALAGGSISRNCIQNLRASQGFRNFREIYDVLQQLQQKDNISEKSSNQHRTQDSQV